MSGNCTRFRVAPVLSALVCAAALLQIGVVGVHTPVHLVLASALAVVTVLAVRVIPPCSIRVDNDHLRVRWPWGREHTLTADDVKTMRVDVDMAKARFLVRSTSLRLFQVDAHRAAEPLKAIESMCTWAAEVSNDRDSTTLLRQAAENARERRAYIEAGDRRDV